MAYYSTHLHQQFVSREQRNREEALCSHYRAIGIQAVAAAKSICKKPEASATASIAHLRKQN
jgi:hypothetical protein